MSLALSARQKIITVLLMFRLARWELWARVCYNNATPSGFMSSCYVERSRNIFGHVHI
jgi:hypothetical protein